MAEQNALIAFQILEITRQTRETYANVLQRVSQSQAPDAYDRVKEHAAEMTALMSRFQETLRDAPIGNARLDRDLAILSRGLDVLMAAPVEDVLEASAFRNRVAHLTSSLSLLQLEMDGLRTRNDSLSRDVSQLRSSVAATESKAATAESEASAAKSSASAAMAKVERLERKSKAERVIRQLTQVVLNDYKVAIYESVSKWPRNVGIATVTCALSGMPIGKKLPATAMADLVGATQGATEPINRASVDEATAKFTALRTKFTTAGLDLVNFVDVLNEQNDAGNEFTHNEPGRLLKQWVKLGKEKMLQNFKELIEDDDIEENELRTLIDGYFLFRAP